MVPLVDTCVEALYKKYLPDNSLLVLDGADIKNIKPKDYSMIVYDLATNPIDVDNFTPSVPGELVSGLLTKPTQAYFFPFWAVFMSYNTQGFSYANKNYKISCLNGTTWNHRKLVYLHLTTRPYFKDVVFSFGNRPPYNPSFRDIPLTLQEQETYSNLPQNVSFQHEQSLDIDLSISHPAYQESYLNVVTETTVSNITPMLSEKTFKPIIAGQLFVLVASPGAVKFLREIGIDTFDDIINHSYDIEQDVRKRIDQALTEVDRLEKLDLSGIYQQIKPRLIKNSLYFCSEEFRSQFPLNFG